MKIQDLLDSMYLVPVVLEHLEKPTATTTRILGDHNISAHDASEVRDLLQYNYDIIYHGYNNAVNFYPELRRGLEQYFNKYLTEGYVRTLEHMPDWPAQLSILDFGAGSGQVAKWLRKRYPDANVITMDRQGSDINVDFEAEPNWWQEYVDEFNIVILSEVLHCKKTITQRYIIDVCQKLLVKGGLLIIVEPVDHVMAYRIAKIKGEPEYNVLDEWHIRELIGHDMSMQGIFKVQRHKFYKYAKI